MGLDAYERIEVRSREELETWLGAHHERGEGVWLVTFKKGSPHYVPREAVLEALIAWGWIDSLPRKLDADRTMLLIAKRKAGSSWSGVNKRVVERLVEAGRMQPPGLAAVERARGDGSWSRLDEVEALTVPDDLAAALDAHPPARARFERFPPSSRRGILEWIDAAKRPATRAKRIAETAEKAAVNRKANFPPGRDRGPALE